ncbi:MAG: DNA polymerase III subunit gamma/tau [Rhodospirillaceae bacterium]|nr:DNA polymerase III subunit gamma/tau [Rhodospirillaceae bacterium]
MARDRPTTTNTGKPFSPRMTDAPASTPYRVLARKYRPTDFSGLIGQEALVRTLSNAIESGRLAHAFLLTGVRGVGKTTTARIIARALNCIGPDGTGGPTVAPCGVCEHCRAIAEDRHVDVLEMDAASRTGIDDIREVISGVRYRPTSARYKVYIIDEVHMLSEKAFNALLKTLEEPPEHVKFVFATTEIRKIPITVLSRCQRFDLRRVDAAELSAHFFRIAEQEKVEIEPEAMAMICRAADGSVRDGLSLLDQAIAHGAGKVETAAVQAMLGLADRARVFDLFDRVMRGDIKGALDSVDQQYALGADPFAIISDMLELTHALTRLKVAPVDKAGQPETERVRGRAMAEGLSMASLTRAWQILLKGLTEVQNAPRPLQAAEMVLVRLAFAADLPSPADALEALRTNPGTGARNSGGGGAPSSAPRGGDQTPAPVARLIPSQQAAPAESMAGAQPIETPKAAQQPETAVPGSFDALVAMIGERGETRLAAELRSSVHLVHYSPGRLEIRPESSAPSDLAQRLSRLLAEWTGMRWMVSLSREPGEATLRVQALEQEIERRRDAARHPLVQAVLNAFPDATIEAVRDLSAPEDGAADETDTEPSNGDEDE